MAEGLWDRRPRSVQERETSRLLREWMSTEVLPFCPFWSRRLGGTPLGRGELAAVPVAEESELAMAGGPGNPALLLMPSEDGFKRYARREDLFAAAREMRSGGAQARRLALFRRYKPVHVHEAGVSHPLAIAYTRTDLDRLHLAGARLMEVLGLGVDDALVSAVPAGPSLRFWGLYHAALGTRMTALHPRTLGRPPVPALIDALAMLPPTALALPAAQALDLLTGLAHEQVQVPGLRTVLSVGPPPDAGTRNALAAAAVRLGAHGARVQAVWAPASSRALWGECRPPAGDPPEATYGLHTYPDLEVLHVRDLDGQPAGENEPGELVITSLGWRGTVLVRAATGARTGGLVTARACPNCGRTVPRLAPQVWSSVVSTS